jgi:hypothetical protein
MARKKTKFEITIEKLSIKYEGVDEDEVRQVQIGVNRLLDSLTHTSNKLMEVEEAEFVDASSVSALPGRTSDRTNIDNNKPKPEKRRAARDSNRSLQIETLKAEGFFAEKRSVADIRAGLVNKGFNFESSDIASTMQYMTKKGEFQREKQDGNFVYWSSIK